MGVFIGCIILVAIPRLSVVSECASLDSDFVVTHWSTKCDDAIEADTLEVEELEAEREECCVEVLEEYQLMRNHEIDRLETQMCVLVISLFSTVGNSM